MAKSVLLIVPPVRLSQKPHRFPLGIAYVASALEAHGVDVTVVDLNLLRLSESSQERYIAQAIKDKDLVGMGGMITMLDTIACIAACIKRHDKNLPVVVGGPLASHFEESILTKTEIDVLVKGEGELVVCQLVDALGDIEKLKEIRGLAFMIDGKVHSTPPPERIPRLDDLPLPAYHLFSLEKYILNRGLPRSTDIITGRGCPYRCTFCFQNFGNQVFFRSVENVIEEVRFLKQIYRIEHFYLEDEFFIQRGEYVREFCSEISKLGVTWAASTRVNTVSLELLRELRKSGCTMLMIGIESFDESILGEMNKQVDIPTIDLVCQWMNEVGIEISPGLIIGMPGETRESVRRTVEGCIRHRIPVCDWTYAFATPYPGTKLYADARKAGLIVDEWKYVQKLCQVGDTQSLTLNLSSFTDQELVALRDEAVDEINLAVRRPRPLFPRLIGAGLRALDLLRNRLTLPDVFRNIHRNHFRDDLSREELEKLFKSVVAMVEIEVFSHCNRKCWFCTNTTVDRASDNVHLPVEFYHRIIEDLARIGFDKTISFSRYNEPLADKVILERLFYARQRLPRATLHLNTNGDYLDVEMLYSLYAAGLRSLNLQVYLPAEGFTDELASALVKERIDLLGLDSRPTMLIPGQWVERSVDFLDTSFRVYARNFFANGSDRGGMLSMLSTHSARQSPCLQPFFNLYIDYNGSVVPCCNIRSDLPEHAGYVVGNLSSLGSDVFTLFGSAMLATWRRNLVGFGPKDLPCSTCRFDIVKPTPVNLVASKIFKV